MRAMQIILSMLAGVGMFANLGGNRTFHHKREGYWNPNGPRECARRVRQIAKGMLTEANGLIRLT